MSKEWIASKDVIEDGKHVGTLDFQDGRGEFHDFDCVELVDRIVFGGATNNCFLESGYILKEDGEQLGDTLSELMDDLKVYYNHGKEHTSRIVCNERM